MSSLLASLHPSPGPAVPLGAGPARGGDRLRRSAALQRGALSLPVPPGQCRRPAVAGRADRAGVSGCRRPRPARPRKEVPGGRPIRPLSLRVGFPTDGADPAPGLPQPRPARAAAAGAGAQPAGPAAGRASSAAARRRHPGPAPEPVAPADLEPGTGGATVVVAAEPPHDGPLLVWAVGVTEDGMPSPLAGPWRLNAPYALPELPALALTAGADTIRLDWDWQAADAGAGVRRAIRRRRGWQRVSPPFQSGRHGLDLPRPAAGTRFGSGRALPPANRSRCHDAAAVRSRRGHAVPAARRARDLPRPPRTPAPRQPIRPAATRERSCG